MAAGVKIGIKQLCDELYDAWCTDVDIAKLLGVSPLQAAMYRDGRTKTPGVKTALAAMRHIRINGEECILTPFSGNQDVLDKVKHYEMSCAQVVRDHGFGLFELTLEDGEL